MKKFWNKIITTKFHIGWVFFTFICLISLLVSFAVSGDEMAHKFKNPSFSGIGTSAHYLTIENQEKSRRDAIQKDRIGLISSSKRG